MYTTGLAVLYTALIWEYGLVLGYNRSG